jgi:hypothetical protein
MPSWWMGVEVQLYSFFNLGVRIVWVVNATPRPLYSQERPGTTVQEAGWALETSWYVVRTLQPVAGKSLYRLRCPICSDVLTLL